MDDAEVGSEAGGQALRIAAVQLDPERLQPVVPRCYGAS